VAPARAEPHFNLGVLERGAGNARAAEDHFRQAITRDPQYADAHYELGTTLLASDRATEALNEYAAALAVRADYPEALFGAARAELELRRWEDARRHYERFVQVAPRAYGAQVAAAKDAIRRLAQR
jgi:tetratricopeptide (TPR) repeat protein